MSDGLKKCRDNSSKNLLCIFIEQTKIISGYWKESDSYEELILLNKIVHCCLLWNAPITIQ